MTLGLRGFSPNKQSPVFAGRCHLFNKWRCLLFWKSAFCGLQEYSQCFTLLLLQFCRIIFCPSLYMPNFDRGLSPFLQKKIFFWMVAQITLSFFVQKRKASTKKSGFQKKKNPSKLLL